MNDKSFCGNCGAELKQGDIFCAGCGCSVKSEDEQPIFVGNAVAAVKKKISNKMIGIIIGTGVVLIAVIGIIVAVCVSGPDASELIGTWMCIRDGDAEYALFAEDGSMYLDGILLYNFDDGELTIPYIDAGLEIYAFMDGINYSKARSVEELQRNQLDMSYYYDGSTFYLYDDHGDKVYNFEKVSDEITYNSEIYERYASKKH